MSKNTKGKMKGATKAAKRKSAMKIAAYNAGKADAPF